MIEFKGYDETDWTGFEFDYGFYGSEPRHWIVIEHVEYGGGGHNSTWTAYTYETDEDRDAKEKHMRNGCCWNWPCFRAVFL